MPYETNYPFVTGALNGSRQEFEKNKDEYKKQYIILKNKLNELQEEKRVLEEKRDALKNMTSSRIKNEEEIKNHLFITFMNTVWNAYKCLEKNNSMEENMRKKEEDYEREYLQLIDEIKNLEV
ncbi:MAG: hypothetical protein ACYCYI_10815 [Saccharofermentanales bacterium]